MIIHYLYILLRYCICNNVPNVRPNCKANKLHQDVRQSEMEIFSRVFGNTHGNSQLGNQHRKGLVPMPKWHACEGRSKILSNNPRCRTCRWRRSCWRWRRGEGMIILSNCCLLLAGNKIGFAEGFSWNSAETCDFCFYLLCVDGEEEEEDSRYLLGTGRKTDNVVCISGIHIHTDSLQAHDPFLNSCKVLTAKRTKDTRTLPTT